MGLVLSKVNDRPKNLTAYDTILVLGSKIDGKNTATATPDEVTKNRLDAAIKLAAANPQAQIIVSGYKGFDEPVTEAAGMADYLEEHKIPSKRIIKEPKARNTFENLEFSKKYFHGKTIIVTSDFHLERSLILAKAQHLTVTGYAAPTTSPSFFLMTGYYSHEVIGLARALILGY